MNCKKKLNKEKTGITIYNMIEKSGLTYESIASELGLKSPRVIYEWVNGNKIPSLIHLVNLSCLLGVKIEDLIAVE